MKTKINNKNGFVLAETLVVIIFVLIIFTVLYNSAVPLLGRYDELSYYDDLDTTYEVYQYKKLFESDSNYLNIASNHYKKLTCSDIIDNTNKCDQLNNYLNVVNQDTLLYFNSDYLEEIKNDDTISYEIKDYLDYLKLESNKKILLLEHDGYISYIELAAIIDSNYIKTEVLKERGACRTYVEENKITYISGTVSCINFNYVWYSGKMWRITAIYPDGSMKLITDNNITAIYWGSSTEFNGSWIYQWLNEDFYDTLVSPEDVLVTNAEWNYSADNNPIPVNPLSIETQKTTEAPVGLLNAYEYTKAYQVTSSLISYNYLFEKTTFWWLLTPLSVSDSFIRYVGNDTTGYGSIRNTYTPPNSRSAHGVRPSIVIKSNIIFKGNGTIDNPYQIVGQDFGSGETDSLLNTRFSGEYVKFDDELYRIVGTENEVTKLTKADYIRNQNSNNTPKDVLKKYIASTEYFGKSSNIKNNTYWDYYLNNTWYNSISDTYKNMMTDGTFYLGFYSGNANYKQTICNNVDVNLNNVVVKLNQENSCIRYSTSNDNTAFIGKVGLLRVGEMFSSYIMDSGEAESMWLITPNARTYGYGISIYSGLWGDVIDSSVAVRPSIYLKSTVKILSGSGTKFDPYVIGL